MKQEIIVLGDIEMGRGTLTDDFISDKSLSKFFIELSKRKHPVDLILNGDTFDFLKAPYMKDGTKTFPRHISSEISLQKIEGIKSAHIKVFKALTNFAKKPHNRIYFIIGNHDLDLNHKEVQDKIKEFLKSTKNVLFTTCYEEFKVYAEHGHEYDFLQKVNMSNIYLTYKKKTVINFPWVSLSLMTNFMFMKEKHPFLERISPQPILFTAHKPILHKLVWEAFKYLFMSIFYYPVRYILDPTYKLPKGLIAEFIRRVRNVHWDVDQIKDIFKRRQKKIINRNKVNVLGHIHEKFVEETKDYVIIQPGTWRDEYIMDLKTKVCTLKKKRYVQVLIDNEDQLKWSLKEYPVKRSTIKFEDILKNEITVLRKAAEEEDYPLRA